MESAKLQALLAEQSAATDHANQKLADLHDLHATSQLVRQSASHCVLALKSFIVFHATSGWQQKMRCYATSVLQYTV